MRQVGDSALQSQILRNQEKIPEIVPESSLFETNTPAKDKKKKIVIHPRPVVKKTLTTPEQSYYDLWGSEDSSAPRKSKPAPKKREYAVGSDMSYRSAKLVNPDGIRQRKLEAEEEERAALSSVSAVTIIDDQSVGDTLLGDAPNAPAVDVESPQIKEKKKKRLLNQHVPKYLPDDVKAKMKQEIRERFLEMKKEKEEELVPEFEKTKEAAEEIQKAIEKSKNKPKKQKKADHGRHLRFIADEPSLEMEAMPSSLREIQADTRPFARLQRSNEVRRKVCIH